MKHQFDESGKCERCGGFWAHMQGGCEPTPSRAEEKDKLTLDQAVAKYEACVDKRVEDSNRYEALAAKYCALKESEGRLREILEAFDKAASPGEWYVAEVAEYPFHEPRQFVRSKTEHTDSAICECWGGTGPRPRDARAIVEMRNAAREALLPPGTKGEK